MLKYYWLKFRKLIIAIGFILGLWQGIVWALPRISEFLNSLPNSGLRKMTLQTNTILEIFALIILCIVYVALSLPYILKKEKTIVIGAEPPKEPVDLPVIEEKHQPVLPINDKETQDAITKLKKVFIDLFVEIKHKEFSNPSDITTLVESHFLNTDSAITEFLFHIDSSKGEKVSTAYKYYKYVDENHFPQPSDEQNPDFNNNFVYGFNEIEMKKLGLNNENIKTGKDLLLHNLQKIIDSVE